jgi:NTE family protein
MGVMGSGAAAAPTGLGWRAAAIAGLIGLLWLGAPGGSPAASERGASAETVRPRVGLVLSGGGARGGAHIGVLRVLDELRVPVDVIVGTSAGSIVGAAFATGMPLAEIEAQMGTIRTADLVRDVARPEVPFRRKADDATNFVGPEVGLGPQGWALPKAAVAGVSLEALLRRLTVRQNDSDFDRLPIPFRAIATDIATGEMVVLGDGSLSTAIRASMAIPGAVNPVEIGGRLLVDGGLVRNLPVDVARRLGADVVIAVNIGTPLLKRSDLTSLLSLSDQMTRLLGAESVQRSLAELGERDVLISPDLSQVSSTDFDQLAQAAAAGERAARDAAERLRVLAVPIERYAQWTARRAQAQAPAAARRTPLAEVRLEGTERVHPEVVRATMNLRPGRPYDPAVAEGDMKRLYATGDFEGVSYHLDPVPGVGDVLTVRLDEKDWGPQYLRFGLGLSNDFRGDASFQLTAAHRWTWLNAFGAEWRNELRLGRENGLRTEFHQPLGPSQRVFAAVHAEAMRVPYDWYVDRQRIARFRQEHGEVGVDVGAPLGTVGEARLGVRGGRVSYRDDTGIFDAADLLPAADLAGVLFQVRLDTLDSLRFPREGEAGGLQVYRSVTQLGAGDAYTKLVAEGRAARSWGPHTVRVAAEMAISASDSPLPAYELYSLGGFLRLSGYRSGELLGSNYRFARVVYSRRLATPGVFDGAYLGTSLEFGRIGDRVSRSEIDGGLRRSLGVHVAVDTPLGPLYLGVGRGDGGRHAVTLFLGPP